MWHMTCDRWEEVNLLSKFRLPSSYGLGVKLFGRYFQKGWLADWFNESVAKVIVDPPRLHRVLLKRGVLSYVKVSLTWAFMWRIHPNCWLFFPIFFVDLTHRFLARVGYATQPISCAWITATIILTLYLQALWNKRLKWNQE